MLPEIKRIMKNAKVNLGGRALQNGVFFDDDDTHFLLGFKSDGKNVENWSGFHSENLMVVVTEASGIDELTYNSIEGILQGNSRMLLVFNPNRMTGEAYQSTRSPLYNKFKLNCMDAPNVVNYQRMLKGEITEADYQKLHIPGQVDWEWLDEKVRKQGWVTQIDKSDMTPTEFDFEWNGKYFRPSNLFRVKILGEFPDEGDDILIPLSWIEAAQERWLERTAANQKGSGPLRLGVDVAGMGRDNTVFAPRRGDYLDKLEVMGVINRKTVHMQTAGKVATVLKAEKDSLALIDTIGEGAGVYSRLQELRINRAISAKGSFGTLGLRDINRVYQFVNMRAYMYWALRDALNPAYDIQLALPPDDMLVEELSDIHWETRSDGKIQLEPKDDIKERIGRSPDFADALALTFYPEKRVQIQDDELNADELGLM
jgi:hypothetical protein